MGEAGSVLGARGYALADPALAELSGLGARGGEEPSFNATQELSDLHQRLNSLQAFLKTQKSLSVDGGGH